MVGKSIINLTSKQVEILEDSMKYLHDMNISQKHLLFFKNTLKKGCYDYEKLEDNLEYIINNCKPTIELGRFIYLLSLINAGSVAWLMSINIESADTPYNAYYYLCIATAILGTDYAKFNDSFQQDLLFNYLAIIFFNVHKYSKSLTPDIDFFMLHFSNVFNVWNLDSVFYRQLDIFITSRI